MCACVGTMSALACGHELIIGMLLVNIPASIDETLLVIYYFDFGGFLHIFDIMKVPAGTKNQNGLRNS